MESDITYYNGDRLRNSVDINGNRFEYTKQTDVTPRGGHIPFGIELK